MVDIETRIEIEKLIDYAYNRTIERINAIESAPENKIYRTIGVEEKNYSSFALGYVNYYSGCLEGILFELFLHKFDKLPTPSEISFISDTIKTRFDKLKKVCLELADKFFKEKYPGLIKD
jgi:hypothetical protein